VIKKENELATRVNKLLGDSFAETIAISISVRNRPFKRGTDLAQKPHHLRNSGSAIHVVVSIDPDLVAVLDSAHEYTHSRIKILHQGGVRKGAEIRTEQLLTIRSRCISARSENGSY
jgi:hypothetical protein